MNLGEAGTVCCSGEPELEQPAQARHAQGWSRVRSAGGELEGDGLWRLPEPCLTQSHTWGKVGSHVAREDWLLQISKAYTYHACCRFGVQSPAMWNVLFVPSLVLFHFPAMYHPTLTLGPMPLASRGP